MSRIEQAFKMQQAAERGESQPTALHKLAEQHLRYLVEAENYRRENRCKVQQAIPKEAEGE